MTVSADRTLDNALDVSRKIPLAALTPSVLTELDGATIEQVTGPGPSATVALARPASSLVFLLAHDGAGALEAGGASPAALAVPPLADFAVSVSGELTNSTARDYSGSLLLVVYKARVPADGASQTGVTP